MDELKGLVFDIQGFSVHDGPGCRTLIFLKGCPLRCAWCANPEGIYPYPQLMYYRSQCKTETLSCMNACAQNAISRKEYRSAVESGKYGGNDNGDEQGDRDDNGNGPGDRNGNGNEQGNRDDNGNGPEDRNGNGNGSGDRDDNGNEQGDRNDNGNNDCISINRDKCDNCISFECTDACNYDALRVSGQYMSVDDIMKKIRRDRQYWGPGGGVTLTGGEPMLQTEFATELLRQCYDSYIHTGIETCGHAPWESYRKVLPYLEWIFYDLKHMDPGMHEVDTGQSNRLILENARRIASGNGDFRLVFRVPVIPGFNDDEDNMRATAKFIAETGRNEVNLLPVHYLGLSKYDVIGLECRYGSMIKVTEGKLEKIRGIFREHSIECYIGSSTPF